MSWIFIDKGQSGVTGLPAVEREITSFRAGVDLSDDATMMVVRVG